LRAGENEQAITAFRNAEIASNGDVEILKRAFYGLLEMGMTQEARAMQGRFTREIIDGVTARMAEFKYVQKTAEPIRVLHHAILLIRQGVKDVSLFEISIRLSMEIGRKPLAIQHLIYVATKAFPGKAKWFASLAPGLVIPDEQAEDYDFEMADELDVRPKSS
jgi:hypothetical protein